MESDCYAVLWSATTLRPYTEGTRFIARTDYEALTWLILLIKTSERFKRLRLRLTEFDVALQFRPGRLNQVHDTLSCGM